jgi:hypothetical protein
MGLHAWKQRLHAAGPCEEGRETSFAHRNGFAALAHANGFTGLAHRDGFTGFAHADGFTGLAHTFGADAGFL